MLLKEEDWEDDSSLDASAVAVASVVVCSLVVSACATPVPTKVSDTAAAATARRVMFMPKIPLLPNNLYESVTK